MAVSVQHAPFRPRSFDHTPSLVRGMETEQPRGCRIQKITLDVYIVADILIRHP